MSLPKLVLTDIDGVWTDGGMYYGPNNTEFKKFNTYDSAGIIFCHELNIPVGIITGEDSELVKRRAEKLNVDYCFLGVKDKYKVAISLAKSLNISLNDIAYIGDDLNDIKLLQSVGLPATVSSAPYYIKKICKYTTTLSGGQGAFREFVEYFIRIEDEDLINDIISKYLIKLINGNE